MATVTISTPADNATVPHQFGAAGAYDTEALGDEGKVNLVRSVVTQGVDVLDTKDCRLPSGSGSGSWNVTHDVPGNTPLTGCVVTATLVVSGSDAATTYVSNITISG